MRIGRASDSHVTIDGLEVAVVEVYNAEVATDDVNDDINRRKWSSFL